MASQWFSGSVQFSDRARSLGEDEYSAGLGLLKQGCCVEAAASLSRATELRQDHPEAWTQLGVALVGMGQSLKARDCFERSLALSPGQPGLWSNLGVLLLHAGKTAEALQAFRRALVLEPTMLPARRNACLALFTLGLDEEAEALFPISADRSVLRSQALREKGDLEGAMEAYQEAICLMERDGFSFPISPGKEFSQEGARKALLAAKERLDAAGIIFFLLAGTLLGVIRNGDVLAHDKDLDLGVAWDVKREQVVETLCAGGLFTVPWEQGILPPDRQWYRSFIHAESGCALDVFFVRPEGDRLLCGFDQHPVPVLSCLTAFSLLDWSWMGRTWKVPDPPEQYLVEVYGPDWRVPNPQYNTVLSNPARTPESLPVVLCLGYFMLYEAMQEQKWGRAKALSEQIQMRKADPFLVDLEARIDRYAHEAQFLSGSK